MTMMSVEPNADEVEVEVSNESTPEVHVADCDGRADVRFATVICRYLKLAKRSWQVGRTRLLWGWRLHVLGSRSILGRSLLINNPSSVAVGARVAIADQFVLADLCPGSDRRPKIVVGDGTTILCRFQCNATQSVIIGRNVLIAPGVFVGDSYHVVEPGGVPVTRNRKVVTRPVRIEDNCRLGQNAAVLKGVTIGHDSIVGANSVVVRDVPPCTVVAGNPARVIKELNCPTPETHLDRAGLES